MALNQALSPSLGRDQSLTGGNADRPNLVGDPKVSDPGPDRWFDPAAFAVPAAGTFGSAGRNILRGDGLHSFDLGVSRFFRVTERQSFQFRAEVFNPANHPNFFFPTASQASSAFGTITRAALYQPHIF